MENSNNSIVIINGKPIEQETQDKIDAFLVSMQQGESSFFDELYKRKEGNKEDENY
jgi:hypothetical protein